MNCAMYNLQLHFLFVLALLPEPFASLVVFLFGNNRIRHLLAQLRQPYVQIAPSERR